MSAAVAFRYKFTPIQLETTFGQPRFISFGIGVTPKHRRAGNVQPISFRSRPGAASDSNQLERLGEQSQSRYFLSANKIARKMTGKTSVER